MDRDLARPSGGAAAPDDGVAACVNPSEIFARYSRLPICRDPGYQFPKDTTVFGIGTSEMRGKGGGESERCRCECTCLHDQGGVLRPEPRGGPPLPPEPSGPTTPSEPSGAQPPTSGALDAADPLARPPIVPPSLPGPRTTGRGRMAPARKLMIAPPLAADEPEPWAPWGAWPVLRPPHEVSERDTSAASTSESPPLIETHLSPARLASAVAMPISIAFGSSASAVQAVGALDVTAPGFTASPAAEAATLPLPTAEPTQPIVPPLPEAPAQPPAAGGGGGGRPAGVTPGNERARGVGPGGGGGQPLGYRRYAIPASPPSPGRPHVTPVPTSDRAAASEEAQSGRTGAGHAARAIRPVFGESNSELLSEWTWYRDGLCALAPWGSSVASVALSVGFATEHTVTDLGTRGISVCGTGAVPLLPETQVVLAAWARDESAEKARRAFWERVLVRAMRRRLESLASQLEKDAAKAAGEGRRLKLTALSDEATRAHVASLRLRLEESDLRHTEEKELRLSAEEQARGAGIADGPAKRIAPRPRGSRAGRTELHLEAEAGARRLMASAVAVEVFGAQPSASTEGRDTGAIDWTQGFAGVRE